jgi:arylsulfatase A-like enzyme
MKHPRPNILVYFSDQQRYDTLGCNGQTLAVTPTLDALARTGINFKHAYTNQPVCGPARAMLQTGLVPTRTGCFRNGIALPQGIPTLARRLRAACYDVAYVGKWHLATTRGQTDYETKPIPPELRGGYDGWWVASDILEFTSHGVGGHLFDADGQKRPFTGYRTDAVTATTLSHSWTPAAPTTKNPFSCSCPTLSPTTKTTATDSKDRTEAGSVFKGFYRASGANSRRGRLGRAAAGLPGLLPRAGRQPGPRDRQAQAARAF